MRMDRQSVGLHVQGQKQKTVLPEEMSHEECEMTAAPFTSQEEHVEENTGQLIFPTFVKMVRIYATLPVTTASVGRSFSKLKIIKNRLRSLCGEERL